MATIEMKKAHTIGKEAARTKAEGIANRMKDKLQLTWAWSGDTIVFQAESGPAKGAKGNIIVSEKEIAVNVDLPLLLRPLKGMVEGKIKEQLDTV